MPKVNIERAIARVADKTAAALIEEVYEGYGPGGVGIIIEAASGLLLKLPPITKTALCRKSATPSLRTAVVWLTPVP